MNEPLTDAELAEVRRIIETDKRRVWLMSNIRSSASWIVVVVGSVVLFWDSFVKVIKNAAGQ
jgi:hypothetical protein|tara:strand:- start:147 stop:332 length:186 start_codon:yes stop_codon:yes gene_type:complete